MLDVEGYVLTGGSGSRMGRDKSILDFGGQTLAQRAAEVLAGFAASVSAVGRPVPGVNTVPDIIEPGGQKAAIFGVHSALSHSRAGWTALLSCDLPFITSGFFHLLISIAETGSADAVVPVQPDERLQPLAAVYRTEPCLAAVETMLNAGQRRLNILCERVGTRRLGPVEYSHLDGSAKFFLNVNTPSDYQAALEAL